MHDRLDHHRMNEDATLAAMLRALPSDTPPPDAWSQLAVRTRRRRTTRRILWTGLPVALAAAFALAVVWPHVHLQQPAPATPRIAQQAAHTPAATAATDLAKLQASSRQWQAWVASLDRNGAPLNGQALARAVSLQDRIGLVDLQLSAARDPATSAALWQLRITLLQRLGLLHLQPYAVARQARATHDATYL